MNIPRLSCTEFCLLYLVNRSDQGRAEGRQLRLEFRRRFRRWFYWHATHYATLSRLADWGLLEHHVTNAAGHHWSITKEGTHQLYCGPREDTADEQQA